MFALLSSAGFMPLAPHSIPSPGLPAHAYAQLRAITATTRYFEMFFAELNAVEESSAEVRDLKTTSFGDLPLTVLGAGRFDADPPLSDAENQQPWKETQVRQSELVALSSEGRQIMAKQSGHFI